VGFARVVLVVLCATGCRQLFGIEPIADDGGGGGGPPGDGRGDGRPRRDGPGGDGSGVDGSNLGACVQVGKTITCPAQDTYVSGGNQTANYGTDPSLVLYTTSAGDLPLVQFDLSGIAASTAISSAQLALTATNVAELTTISLYGVTAPWLENEATWQAPRTGVAWIGGNGPTYEMSSFASFSVASGANSVDVTSRVRIWIQNPSSNAGFVLETGNTGMWSFASNDDPTPANRPSLVITLP